MWNLQSTKRANNDRWSHVWRTVTLYLSQFLSDDCLFFLMETFYTVSLHGYIGSTNSLCSLFAFLKIQFIQYFKSTLWTFGSQHANGKPACSCWPKSGSDFLFPSQRPSHCLLLNAIALFTWKWRSAGPDPFTVIKMVCYIVIQSCPAESYDKAPFSPLVNCILCRSSLLTGEDKAP